MFIFRRSIQLRKIRFPNSSMPEFIYWVAKIVIPASPLFAERGILGRRHFYCPFHVLVQPNFRRYYFYFLPDQAQILLDHFNVLDELWGEIWQMENFPIDPHCKNCGQLLQCRSMGKCYICCRVHLKFRLRVRLKRWNDREEFELDRARSKNNIAENSVALASETHNTVLIHNNA